MQTAQFLQSVITTDEGHFLLATRQTVAGWQEHWDYMWPRDLDNIVSRALHERNFGDVYFSAHLFAEKSSRKDAVLPTLTLQADLDGADVRMLPVQPTCLTRTSPDRHQGFWRVRSDVALPVDEIERLSRRLSYAIEDCDRSGWTLGHRMRLPGTLNWKYKDAEHPVDVVEATNRSYDPSAFDVLPDADPSEPLSDEEFSEWLSRSHTPHDTPVPVLLDVHRRALGARLVTGYTQRATDRSAALWHLECEAFRAGLSRDEVYWLAYNSPNNKWRELRAGGVYELRKDVLRAERRAKRAPTNLREAVMLLRGGKELAAAKRQNISELVRSSLLKTGELLHSKDDRLWYVERAIGRPVSLSVRSSALLTLLNLRYGLNTTEQELKHTIGDLMAYTASLPPTVEVRPLSYYVAEENVLLLHTGGRDVLRISADAITTVPNSHDNVLFAWSAHTENLSLARDVPPGFDWARFMFDSSLTNLQGMSQDAARTLLAVWVIFVLIRNAASSRPLLAVFGQPGAGKTTLFNTIYQLLYGWGRAISAVTSADDFDNAVSNDPLVALDNVDTWERWLPDRLALAAGTTDVSKRVLYSDNDQILIRRSAIVCLTAHNPQFAREDVADRLLIMTLARRTEGTHLAERDLLDRIHSARPQLWAAVVRTVQKVLATPMPSNAEVPPFRVADFAKLGLWIARGMGPESEAWFREALVSVRGGQRTLVLEDDQLLVTALQQLAAKTTKEGEQRYKTAQQVWAFVTSHIPTESAPSFMRQYKDSVRLGKKLWVMQESLRSLLNVEFTITDGARVWRFSEKE